MTTRRIRWLELELEGFGVWRDPVRFRLPDGLAILTLSNEGGKSTMVAGLRAALFGLSGESDPLRDGIGRYRSWGFSGACRGRLDLQAGDRRIRIQRDFVTHDTLVSEIDGSGGTERALFEGNANPAGKTAKPREYAEILKELIGDLADEELFAATFLVQQPILPAAEMGDALRRLVSGVGRVGGNEARDTLFEEVKSLTRTTGDRKLIAPGSKRPTNQRTDGAIEELEKGIAALEGKRDQIASDFDRLVQLEKELAAAQAAERAAAEDRAHARADAERIESYRGLADDLQTVRAARDDLQRALETHDLRIAEAEAGRTRIAEEFRDLADDPEDIEERIEAALRLESERASLQASISGQRKTVDRSAEGAQRLRAALPVNLQDEQTAGPVGWMARTREAANRWRVVAGRFLKAEDLRGEQERSRSRFAPIAVLPPEVVDSLARLPESLKELKDRARMASELESSRRKHLEELKRRRDTLDERFACIKGTDSAYFLSVLETRSAQHRKIKELVTDIERLRKGRTHPEGWRWKRGILIGLPASLLAGVVAIAGRLPLVLAMAAFLMVLAAIFLLLSRPPREAQRRARRIAACEHEISEIRDSLRIEYIPSGPWLPDDEGLLDRAKKFFGQRDDEVKALAEAEAELPKPETIGETEKTRTESHEAIERLEEQARQIEEATGLPAPEAVGEYRRLGGLLEDTEEERQNAWRELVGGNEPELTRLEAEIHPLDLPITTLAGPWEPLRHLSTFLEPIPATLRELHDRLNGLSPEQWDTWEETARNFVEARSELEHVTKALSGNEEKLRRLDADLQAARRDIGEARLERSENSLEKLRRRLRTLHGLKESTVDADRGAHNALQTARNGPYEDRMALATAHRQQDERRRDLQFRIDEASKQSELVRSYAAQEPKEQDRIRRELHSRAERTDGAWREAQRKVDQAGAAIENWRPPEAVNLAALDLEIDQRKQDLAVLQERCDAVVQAWFLMEEAIKEFQSSHREELETRLDARFREITNHQKRRVRVSEDLLVTLLEDGISSIDHQLSQGARDQLAFCLRLAVADLVAGDLILPLILDDPFVHSDAERIERIRQALEGTARERQLILLTQEHRLSEWGSMITIESVT